jgi:hypothetical protein
LQKKDLCLNITYTSKAHCNLVSFFYHPLPESRIDEMDLLHIAFSFWPLAVGKINDLQKPVTLIKANS